jgi:hypothetical protein
MVLLMKKLFHVARLWLPFFAVLMMAAEPAFAVKKFIRVSRDSDDAEEEGGSMSLGSSDMS